VATAARIKANRTNARASTGPKTANGRARSAQNAFKHGLTLHIRFFPEFSAEIEALAREIVGPNAHAEIEGLARQVAEAHLDVCRVRQVRHQFVSSKMKDPLYESQSDRRAKCKFLIRVLSRVFRLKWPKISESILLTKLSEYLLTVPEGAEKFLLILSQESRMLLAFDRYERRALSRRKSAIRALDEARSV